MRVLIVGDSQAEGAPGSALEARLRGQGVETRRIGYVGHGAYDWTRMHWPEYQAALSAFQPDQVIMVFGSNDAPNANLEQAMQRFKASASKVYYAGPPRYDRVASSQALSVGIRDMAKRVFGNKHLDAWPYTGASVPRAGDGLHFTAAGGATWADGMVRDLSAVASGATAGSGWVGPAILAGSAAVAVLMFWWSRRCPKR